MSCGYLSVNVHFTHLQLEVIHELKPVTIELRIFDPKYVSEANDRKITQIIRYFRALYVQENMN